MTGGTVSAGAFWQYENATTTNTVLNISGGTVAPVEVKNSSTLTLSGTVNGNFTLNKGTYNIASGTTINGQVTLDGATLTLAGGTITGTVTVNGGSATAPAFKITSGKIDVPSQSRALVVNNGGFAEIAGGIIESDNMPLQIKAGGTVEMTAGTVQTTQNNNGAGIGGSFTMTGGEILSTGSRAIRIDAGGNLSFSGNAKVTGSDSIQDDSASGIIRISGGSLTGIKTGANTKVYITGGTLSKSVYGTGTCYVGDANTAYTINSNLTLECTNTEIRNVTINGTVTPKSGTVNIYDTTVNATGKALTLNNSTNVTVYAEDSTFETSNGIAVHVNGAAKVTLKNCTLRSRKTADESSALRVQDFTFDKNENGVDLYKGYVNVTGGTIENYGTHPAILFFRGAVINLNDVTVNNYSSGGGIGSFDQNGNNNDGKKNYVTVNGGTFTTGSGAALSLSDKDDVLVVSNATVVSSSSKAAIAISKGTATVNNCTVTNIGGGSALNDNQSANAATITVNGGTYSASYAVLGSWGGDTFTFGADPITVYSHEYDANGSWVFRGINEPQTYVAFVRCPGGVYPNPSTDASHNFQLANAEASVAIGENTYYVYTGAKGGAPVSKGGASVRIEGTDAGLRFTSYISIKTINAAEAAKKAGTTVEYGTAIFPTALITAAGLDTFDPLALEELGYTVAWVVANEGQTAVKDANDVVKGYTVRAALVGIKESHYEWDYSAIAYIKYTNADGEDVYLFGNYSEADNSRSIVEVAQAALNDTATKRGDGYIYRCEDGTYSPYTTKQREILKGYVD